MFPAQTPRRALVDARALWTSGIGRYLREVLSVLLRDDRFSRILLLGEPAEIRDFASTVDFDQDRLRIIDFTPPMYSLSLQSEWLRVSGNRELNADVTFFPHYDVPLWGVPAQSVVTVHDLIHFKVPEAFPAAKRFFTGIMLRRAVDQAGLVLSDSTATRHDLAERFPHASQKLAVVPLGVTAVFQEDSAGLGARPVPYPYLLSVGNRKAHKNLAAILEVLARLSAEEPDLRVVFAGKAYPGWELVLRRAEELRLADRIVDLGEVSDARLKLLYQHAETLIFPSLYEGFGLPILEAMAAGTPVVSSNRASLPEVGGDAAILLDPDDYEGMASAVLRMRRDPVARREIVRRGIARSRGYTWAATASRTVDYLFQTSTAGSRT